MSELGALAEVRAWGERVGAIAEDADGRTTFEYDEAFRTRGVEISPIHLPLDRTRGPVEFPELRRSEAFVGLPGVLADSLPDRFGNAVIARYFAERGTPDLALSPVQRLLYIGDRAMGALEFRPALDVPRLSERVPLEIADLVRQARGIVERRSDVAIPEIMRVGASAGGMRPKAVVLWNPETRLLRSAHARARRDDEHWLIKFDGVSEAGATVGPYMGDIPRPYMRIEFAYMEIARRAGLDVPPTRLVEERGYGHLMVRRFDRRDGERVHQHSLGGMRHVDYNQPGAFSYEGYLRTILRLNLGHAALLEGFRRMVFNVVGVNQDDHVKNLSFLMDRTGVWRLSPVYDLTFARGQGWTRTHQMTVAGKRFGIERADLEAISEQFGLGAEGSEAIDRVCAAFGVWEDVAGQAMVPPADVATIRGALEGRGLAARPGARTGGA